MASKKAGHEAIYSMLLMAVLTATLVQPGTSMPLPTNPGFLPGYGKAVIECWSPLMKIPGCILHVYESIYNLQFRSIGSDCCEAYVSVKGNCLPNMFPFNPLVPSLLYGYCLVNNQALPPTGTN
ncbi:uncharacterized protein LOC107415652 [Ziziphus jujuba]|uniref:Uncharacterized protein LOC107415652 n=2 Tax=Ziziphus jujuba TaxID=326968 RepID=A0A6P3ZVH9_ZIZJJ|nr:uncharacterized protein LOC107415652 [Ziziphus jujuba]KAH7546296.1 hypothetical protein FEM48_Zijuj01G0185300 [Ziziphus jujuba var. spinosa]